MTENILVEFYGKTVRYICPNCGTIIELYEHTKDMFIENDVPYFCEGCDEPINFKSDDTRRIKRVLKRTFKNRII